MPQCLRCGGTEFDYGRLVTTGAASLGALTGMDILYKTSNERKGKKIWIRTITCLNCGHIELYLNPKQLR